MVGAIPRLQDDFFHRLERVKMVGAIPRLQDDFFHRLERVKMVGAIPLRGTTSSIG